MPIAEQLPVAQVRIDSPLPHLDRVFDYAVPATLDEAVQVGVRVRIRFSGRLIDGLVVGRSQTSQAPGTLRPIDRVIGVEPVVTAQTLALIEAVATRMAGTFWDVFRSAVPPRHARAEGAPAREGVWESRSVGDAWASYAQGDALMRRLAGAETVRAVWSAAPATSWIDQIADAVRAVLGQPTGDVVVVVPDAWDVEQLRAHLADVEPTTSVLTADLGPEARYRAFVRILRGHSRLVIGTRNAVFAPVANLRLLIVWNDGEEPMWEPHAPYWNARDVAALRSHLSGCALLIGAPARSPEAHSLCTSGWAISLVPSRRLLTAAAPIVRAIEQQDSARDPAAASARIPHTAWLVAKEALRTGPVLVQVARRGYVPIVSCAQCRTPAVCSCGGALSLPSRSAAAVCSRCATIAGDWRCPACGSPKLRAGAVGVERTAEEFGRAFPDTRIIWSDGERPVRRVDGESALVVATSGVEPVADGGYAAVLLLDARAQLQRPSMRAGEEAAQRWFAAASLARPRAHVVVTAENASSIVQSLVRWDAAWLAERELADRASAGLPPAVRAAVLRGEHAAVVDVEQTLSVPHRALGPVDGRTVVLVARDHGTALAHELKAISATRSAKSLPVVNTVLDPRTLD